MYVYTHTCTHSATEDDLDTGIDIGRFERPFPGQDFAECISRKDFRAATELCKQQLQKTPDSRYVWEPGLHVGPFLVQAPRSRFWT